MYGPHQACVTFYFDGGHSEQFEKILPTFEQAYFWACEQSCLNQHGFDNHSEIKIVPCSELS